MQRCARAAAFGSIGALPALAWMAYVARTSGTAGGREAALAGTADAGTFYAGLLEAARYVLPTELPVAMRLAALALALVLLAAATLAFYRRAPAVGAEAVGERSERQPHRYLPLILLVFVGTYSALIVLAVLVEPYLPISDRYLYPLYVALVLLGATTVPALARTTAMRRMIAVAVVGFVALCAARAAKVAGDGYERGWGYAAERWRSSPAVAYVNALPSGAVVYSDDPYALLFLTEREIHGVPNAIVRRRGTENPDYRAQTDEMRERLRATNGVVVIFERDRGEFVMPVLPKLMQAMPLDEKTQLDDATVYALAEDDRHAVQEGTEMVAVQHPAARNELELTILMPCLDEAETIGTCIDKARNYLDSSGVRGEVLVADNGSTDGSREIAEEHGARLVRVAERGYGAALKAGIQAAHGRFVIMGDADDSYDFSNLHPFVTKLRDGAELVMGNRFKGGIAPGAMPRLHKYLGNPVLSGIGRLFFKSPIGDFHCGLRGFDRQAISGLGLQSPGHGVRERDGREGDAAPKGDRRGADDAAARRPLASAAFA